MNLKRSLKAHPGKYMYSPNHPSFLVNVDSRRWMQALLGRKEWAPPSELMWLEGLSVARAHLIRVAHANVALVLPRHIAVERVDVLGANYLVHWRERERDTHTHTHNVSVILVSNIHNRPTTYIFYRGVARGQTQVPLMTINCASCIIMCLLLLCPSQGMNVCSKISYSGY